MPEILTHSLSVSDKEACLTTAAQLLKGLPELIFAYAYGSFVASGPFRDLDIALFVEKDRLPERVHAYEAQLEKALKRGLQASFPIEARVVNDAGIPFLFSVIQGRLLVDNDPAYRIERVSEIIARYLDIEPLLRHHAREAFSGEAQP
jgi:predicted nucleotidyltransferase